jgi:hypothetical protein
MRPTEEYSSIRGTPLSMGGLPLEEKRAGPQDQKSAKTATAGNLAPDIEL